VRKLPVEKFFKRLRKFNAADKPKFEAETIRILGDYLHIVIDETKVENTSMILSVVNNGHKEEIQLLEDSSFVFHRLLTNIQKYPPSKKGNEYHDVTKRFLAEVTVPLHLKAQLVLFEVSFLESILKQYIKDDYIGLESLEQRLEILSLCIDGKVILSSFSDNALEQAYRFFISSFSNVLTLKGHLIQCLNYLEDRLLVANSAIIKSALLKSLVGYATSYNLLSKRELEDRVEEYGGCLDEEELEFVKLEIDAETSGGQFFYFGMSVGSLSLENTRGKNISTSIRFSIPIECVYDKPVTIVNDEGKPKISIIPIETFWTDPIFGAFMDFKIGNIGWSYFSDLSVDAEGKFCHVIIDIDGLYIPDIELFETTSKSIDFSEKEQIEGKRYHPHKEFAVKNLLQAFEELEKVIVVKGKKDISANLFSNFIVQYIDNDNQTTIKHSLKALTSHGSFAKTRSRFLEQLSSRNLSDTYISMRSLIGETTIESERNLREFVERTLSLIVKKNIEDEGGYGYFWKDTQNDGKVPITEPQMQPYILGHLKILYEYMGIQISRECVSANGQIDFLVTFSNSKNDLLRVCVELKLAHNAKLDDGIINQLPRYMRAERAKQGVFLVLWFKCQKAPFVFNNPSAYNSLEQLKDKLISINTDRNISIVTIDCSKPISPSKLKTNSPVNHSNRAKQSM
jgi:hypothetical protein